MKNFGPLVDVPVLLITFYFIIKYKLEISNLFLRIPLPNFLVYLISSLPFIIFEENINCGAFNCNHTILPFTLPFLLIYMTIIWFFYIKIKPKNIKLFITIFCLIGVLFEIFLGVSNVEFRQLPIFWFVFIGIWVGISYAYLMVVPLTILEMKKNKK